LLCSPYFNDTNKTNSSKVQRLKNVFENIYNYNVESVQIDSRLPFPRPQAQANLAVAQFVSLNDKENTLFIVYYAGHGSPGKDLGELNLTGYVTCPQVRMLLTLL
jgi:hypothetical protein